MSSRRYSLTGAGSKLSFFRKSVRRESDTGSSILGRRSDQDPVDCKVQHIKRVMNSVHPGHCFRQLPGQAQLYQIFGNHRIDRVTCKIDCDEVYPNILIGNE